MEDMITVPNSTKNLLSVGKFCSDNSVSIEFESQTIKVKNRMMGLELFGGKVDENLYTLHIPSSGS